MSDVWSDGENQITTVAEIHPVPEAAVTVNSSEVMLDNNVPSCDFEFLGVKPKAKNIASEPLHTELAAPFYKKASRRSAEKKLWKDILEDCPLMKPPKLTTEISSCLDEKSLRQDNFMAKIQEQAGHTLTILGNQLNKQLSKNHEDSKELITSLADAAQLICNVHHAISTHRKYNI
nr:unnamed protein product [Callosobruchus analis]